MIHSFSADREFDGKTQKCCGEKSFVQNLRFTNLPFSSFLQIKLSRSNFSFFSNNFLRQSSFEAPSQSRYHVITNSGLIYEDINFTSLDNTWKGTNQVTALLNLVQIQNITLTCTNFKYKSSLKGTSLETF